MVRSNRTSILIVMFSILLVNIAFSATKTTTAKTVRPRLAIDALEHSFGTVKPGTPLSFTFKISNTGDANLEILNVSPSCGCTTSNYDKSLEPGKTGGITLTVGKTDGYKGEVVKNATVSTNDPDHPSFTLTLRANFSAE